MAENNQPWVGMAQHTKLGRPPKHDYDDDEFYDQVFYYALNGATNTEIGIMLDLLPDTFIRMVNGTYSKWSEEQNEKRSKRLVRVLTSAREKINLKVRGRYLQAALGGIKVKSKVTRYIKGEEDETMEVVQETETELAPNMQALTTWMYHHDPEFRKIQRGAEPTDSQNVSSGNIEQGVAISAWIEDHCVVKGKQRELGKKEQAKDCES